MLIEKFLRRRTTHRQYFEAGVDPPAVILKERQVKFLKPIFLEIFSRDLQKFIF